MRTEPGPDAGTGAAPPGWFERLAVAFPRSNSPLSPLDAPDDGSARRSAVLALFGPGSGAGPEVLLTQRSAHLRQHAGQVAFPGGGIDPGDAGPQAAALREAVEETGLDPAGVQIRATGPDLYMSVTNFLVTPVVGWWRRPSAVGPGDPAEVMRVVPVRVADLLDPANRFQVRHPSGYTGPGFEAGGLFVWGFTAGVLSWLIALAGLERPWDARRVRPLPDETGSAAEDTADDLAEDLAEQADERVRE